MADIKPEPADNRNSDTTKTSTGFFDRLLKLFSRNDPELEKKRLLKLIAKDLQHSRYRFYKAKARETLPGMARFFYEIYRVVAPAQVFLGNTGQSAALRTFVIESFLSKEQKELAERLGEAHINEKAATMPVKDLQEMVKRDMISFFSAFDAEKINRIDTAYSTLISFANFANFDYYFLLKKFDSAISERNFTYNPKWETIPGDYVADDLHDFLELFIPLNLDADWKRIFSAFREYRGVEIIQTDAWTKLVSAIRDVRSSGILELIIKHIKSEPNRVVTPRITNERISEAYIERLKNQSAMIVQKISQERRNTRIDELAKHIFGTSVIVRMKNYTEKANIIFSKRMLGGYTHTQALNYLKAFLIDYFKKDVREIVDNLLIRGKWSVVIQSQQLSDAYHSLMDVSASILEFDDTLADDGETGSRFRTIMAKADRDRDQVKYLRQILGDVNDKALALVNKSALNLIAIGRHFKTLLDDMDKPRAEVILNWKEVENHYENPLKPAMIELYKKIYYMVQLLQYFVKEDKE